MSEEIIIIEDIIENVEEFIENYIKDKKEKFYQKLELIKTVLPEFYDESNYEIVDKFDSNINVNSDFIDEIEVFENPDKTVIEDLFKEWYSEVDVLDIIIKYDELTISNSENKTHNIKNLFVKIGFNYDCCIKGDIEGLRTFLYAIELNNFYRHSHLSSETDGKFSRFCLGDDTPLRMLLVEFSNPTWIIEDLRMFFYCLEEYVRWESLEGGPYRKIKDLGYKKNSSSSARILNNYDFIKDFFKSLNSFDNLFFINIDSKNVQVNYKKILLKKMADYIIHLYINKLITYDVLRANVVILDFQDYPLTFFESDFEINSDIRTLLSKKSTIINFKGIDYTLEIEDISNPSEEQILETIKNKDYYAHPKIGQFAERTITAKIESELFSKKYISSYWKRRNNNNI